MTTVTKMSTPAALAVICVAAGPAHAFTVESIVTPGCHESITTDAFRVARAMFDTAPPLPATTNDDRALLDDSAFAPAPDMKDLGGATLLIGVRDNDLAGRNANDLSNLALIHGDPTTQQLHCLHPADTPEPAGSQAALAACRTFILDKVAAALDGLDTTGKPDAAHRTSLPVFLGIRHRVDVSLPTYYVRIGQALHALEDSLAHSYRAPDDARVTAVVNWVNLVENDYHESVDGPPHSTDMDRCDDPDDLRRTRRVLATQAAAALLQATLDPTQSRGEKMTAAAALLDRWLAYAPGCTAENGWCAAPERRFTSNGISGCAVGPSRGVGWGAVTAAAAALLAISRRGRRGRTAALVVLAVCGLAPDSVADESWPATAAPAPAATTTPAAAGANVPPPRTTPVPEPGPWDRSQTAWGGYLGVAGSASNPAFAASVGVRLRATRHWTFGLDAEWNPWIALNGVTQVRAGAFNGYGTAIFRVPLAYQRFNLRITGSAGFSTTLIDLYGVPKGSTGIFAALFPLGVEWKATRLFYVVASPLGFAAAAPQLRYVPFWYPQYRAAIGIEIYAH